MSRTDTIVISCGLLLTALVALVLVVVLVRERRRWRVVGVQMGDLWVCKSDGETYLVHKRIGGGIAAVMLTYDGQRLMTSGARLAGEWWLVLRDGVPTPQHLRERQKKGGVL